MYSSLAPVRARLSTPECTSLKPTLLFHSKNRNTSRLGKVETVNVLETSIAHAHHDQLCRRLDSAYTTRLLGESPAALLRFGGGSTTIVQ